MDKPGIDYVDYASINFPSDRLTIADLRRQYPTEFGETPPPPPEHPSFLVKLAAEHGKPLPPIQPDWLFEQLRSMPADQTFRQLRRHHQDIFDVEDGMEGKSALHYEASAAVEQMLDVERALARMAYQVAVGKPNEVNSWIELPERDGYREDLIRYYQMFGLIGDEAEGRELIEKFEKAATVQGAGDRPRPPDPRSR